MDSDTTLSSFLAATISTANSISALPTPLSEDVRACAQLLSRVCNDLDFLVTLRARHLQTSLFESQRIDNIIADATSYLSTTGSQLEGFIERERRNGGKSPLLGRLKRGSSDSMRFVVLSRGLGMQQVAIMGEVNWLRRKEQSMMVIGEGRGDGEDTFENVELLRLRSRKPTALRDSALTSISASMLPTTAEEGDLLLISRAVEPFPHGKNGKIAGQHSTTESQSSSKDDNAEVYDTIEDPSRLLSTSFPTQASPILSNSPESPIEQHTQGQPSHNDIEVPLHNNTPIHQKIHPRASTSSLSSISTRGRSNTFALQALRESEFEEEFLNSPSSPSSSSFLSSRMSTISSRTSNTSLSRHNSHARSFRSSHKPPDVLTLEQMVDQDTEGIGSEVVPAKWLADFSPPSVSAQSFCQSQLQYEGAVKVGEEPISDQAFIGQVAHQSSSPPPQDLTIAASRLSLQSSDQGEGTGSRSLHLVPMGGIKSLSTFSIPAESTNEDVDDEDSYFRDLKRQEIEKKRRLAAMKND